MNELRNWFEKRPSFRVQIAIIVMFFAVLYAGYTVITWARSVQGTMYSVRTKVDIVSHEVDALNSKIEKYHLLGDGK